MPRPAQLGNQTNPVAVVSGTHGRGMVMKRILIVICAIAALALVSNARAQQTPLENPKLDAKACADRERLALADTHQGPQVKETEGANPSEKLARTDGVICPPADIDPDIRARAPGGGRTPVISPSAIEPGTQAK